MAYFRLVRDNVSNNGKNRIDLMVILALIVVVFLIYSFVRVHKPELDMPDFKMPDIKMPDLPDLEMPDMTNLKLPKLPKIDLSFLNIVESTENDEITVDTPTDIYVDPKPNEERKQEDPFTDRHIYTKWPYIEYEQPSGWKRFDNIRY